MKKEFTMPEVEFIANEPIRTEAYTADDLANDIYRLLGFRGQVGGFMGGGN